MFADGDALRRGAGSADITAAPGTVVAEGRGSSAGLELADEERRRGRQRWVGAEVLGVQKREKRYDEEGGMESLGVNHLMWLLL